ncbi:phage/plasmid primase, P4 family [Microbacterium sp. 1S1]|uniref:phage/plasmid primase, P4 family n=1 Tax=Microbacterium sp. 1S1 TaxID=2606451 RepID=UPI0011EB11DD|nr:phage/plasmid primase, P4 family [Microbacterium sp. 1S1]
MLYSELISRLNVTGRTSDGILAVCPAHEDRPENPHLRITITEHGKVLIHCRVGCSNKTVLKALDMTLRDIATIDISDAPPLRSSTSKTPAGVAEIAALATQLDTWSANLDDDGRNYAQRRFGITSADAERLQLGSVTQGGVRRLVVPFLTPQGVPRGYQGRDIDGTHAVKWLGPKNPRGSAWSRMAWLPGSTDWNEVLIVEGPGDGLTAAAIGYDAIAIAGAAGVNASNADEIASWVDGRPVVICGDGDTAGSNFNSNLAKLLVEREVSVRVLDVPEGLDLSDWRAQEGEAFRPLLMHAIAEKKPLALVEVSRRSWNEKLYSLTDLGAARYLLAYIKGLGADLRYTPETGFMTVDKGVWRPDGVQQVRTWAQQVADIVRAHAAVEVQNAEGKARDSDEQERATRWSRFAAAVQSSRGLSAMVRELQALPGVGVSFTAFDQHNHLAAFTNGVVDLRTGDLGPHDPSLLLTKSFRFDYDPEATAPRWVRFIEEAHPEKEGVVEYFQVLLGYGITGHTSEACFIVNYGVKGGNGKSTMHEAIADVCDDFTVTTAFSVFEEKPAGGISNDTAALKGARFALASEGNAGKAMDEAKLKSVTGGDRVTARFLHKDNFTFKPNFLLLLASNNKPAFKGQDGGLWRRVKMIHWNHSFTEAGTADPNLGATLRSEAQGIATWLVQGAVRWHREGLRDPQWIKDATKTYKATSDALAGFFPGNFVADASSRCDGATLYESYTAWTKAEGLPLKEVWTRRAFYGALTERGLVQRKTNKGQAFDGIRPANDADRAKAAEEDKANSVALPSPETAVTAVTASVRDVPSLDDWLAEAPTPDPIPV